MEGGDLIVSTFSENPRKSLNSPLIPNIRIFNGECVKQPQRHIGDGEEGDQLPAGLVSAELLGIAAASHGINDPRRLNHDLDELAEDDANVEGGTIVQGRHQTEDCLGEECGNGDEEQEVIQLGNGMCVYVHL